MNTVKNFIAIHFWLNQIDVLEVVVLEVVVLSLSYVIKYIFQIKQKI